MTYLMEFDPKASTLADFACEKQYNSDGIKCAK